MYKQCERKILTCIQHRNMNIKEHKEMKRFITNPLSGQIKGSIIFYIRPDYWFDDLIISKVEGGENWKMYTQQLQIKKL